MARRFKLHIVFAVMAVFASTSAAAQVNKCKGPKGQTIYSDRACEDGSQSQNVDVHQNTMDGEYDRRDASKRRISQEVDSLMSSRSRECRFAYFSSNDSRGKELAMFAKRECMENMLKEREGLPPSNQHYRAWNDHHNRASNARQQAATRAAITQSHNNAMRRPAPSYKCRADGLGGVNCNPQ